MRVERQNGDKGRRVWTKESATKWLTDVEKGTAKKGLTECSAKDYLANHSK